MRSSLRDALDHVQRLSLRLLSAGTKVRHLNRDDTDKRERSSHFPDRVDSICASSKQVFPTVEV